MRETESSVEEGKPACSRLDIFTAARLLSLGANVS